MQFQKYQNVLSGVTRKFDGLEAKVLRPKVVRGASNRTREVNTDDFLQAKATEEPIHKACMLQEGHAESGS
jgi:hypothetical protein